MYQEHNCSFYKWDGGNLVGSIIYHDERDGVHPNAHGVQIHTSDGGLLAIGYIRHSEFDAPLAKAICDAALRKNRDYKWWIANARKWWVQTAEAGAGLS